MTSVHVSIEEMLPMERVPNSCIIIIHSSKAFLLSKCHEWGMKKLACKLVAVEVRPQADALFFGIMSS